MIPINKRRTKLTKVTKSKTGVDPEFSCQSFLNNHRMDITSDIHNNRYFQNPREIKEIDIKNIPKDILLKNKTKNRHQRNKLKNIPQKINSSFSNDNISDSLPKYQNNTFTQRTIQTYEIPLNQKFWNKIKDRENHSMDITYYKPIIYINKNESTNSFCKKSENSDFFSHNNSFFMNNNDDNINLNINLNNTINYNKEKYSKQKNSLTTIKSIPKPKKFRKNIPPIPIKKFNESSFYFDENETNVNTNNKIKSGFCSYKNKSEICKKIKNDKYSNKTYSMGYIKSIEKIGIQLSFSGNKIKDESIDLISPQIFKNLKKYSSDKPNSYSDLDNNKIQEFTNNENDMNKTNNIKEMRNLMVYNKMEDYEKMRKKYNTKLSNYLLKNKRNRSKKNTPKEKYNIIDIKEKIKEEKRNRSLSELFKYRKKEIIKENPSATIIKKQDDIGGKIDLKIQNINNKKYRIKTGLLKRFVLKNLIKQCDLGKTSDKGEIIINAAKTIQKWWRDLLSKIFIVLNIIKIQSIFRSFIVRKNLLQRKNNNSETININNNDFSLKRKKKKFIYKKIISKHSSNSRNSNSFKSRNEKHIITVSNNSFKILSNDEDIKPILIKGKNNLKKSYCTKEYYRKIGEEKIIYIQRYIKNHLNKDNSNNNFENINIIKIPLIPFSYTDKKRYKNYILSSINNIKLLKKPLINICSFTKDIMHLKKKKPITYSMTNINYQCRSYKTIDKKKAIIYEIDNKNKSLNYIHKKSEKIFKSPIGAINYFTKDFIFVKDKIYKYPLKNICYIDKINKNNNDNLSKKINIIQNKYRNYLNKSTREEEKIYKKNLILLSFITKNFKDDALNKNKILLIQNSFRKYKNRRNEKNIIKNIQNIKIINNNLRNNKISSDESDGKINDLKLLIKKYYINYIIVQLRKNVRISKLKDFLKMLTQRIKKIINEFTFEKLKLNDLNKISKNGLADNNSLILSKLSKDYNQEKETFFFYTLKLHLKINRLDNDLKEDNEVVKLLKETIPECFNKYRKKNYIPYIKKKHEKNLVNQQIYLFDDDQLANYIFKCYKIEKNELAITPDIIKKRLNLENLKNQNIFTITRYMLNLYNDFINNYLCKNCFCKNSEVCLSGCICHKMTNLKLHNKYINNELDSDKYENLNINNESNIKNKKDSEIKDNQRYSDNDSSINTNIKKCYTYNKYGLSPENIDNINIKENPDFNSINTERYDNKNNHRRINNFIRNFTLRKKIRNSNTSNITNPNEEVQIYNLNFNLNNNLKEKASPKINSNLDNEEDKSNIEEEEDIEINESCSKINYPLIKKKMKMIEPISNKIKNLMTMANTFRNRQYQIRKKNKETIKLRDSINYDYEYYENV